MYKQWINNLKEIMKKIPNHEVISTVYLLLFVIISWLFAYLVATDIIGILSWDIGFVDPSTAFAESLIKLYNIVWFFLILVMVLVAVLMIRIIYLFSWRASFFEAYFLKSIVIYSLMIINYLNLILDDKKVLLSSIRIFNKLEANRNLINLWFNKNNYEYLEVSDLSEYKQLEVIWCVIPAGVLLSLVSPTFSLVFSLDSCADPAFTIKVIGKQWYWTYSYDVDLVPLSPLLTNDKILVTDLYSKTTILINNIFLNTIENLYNDGHFSEFFNRLHTLDNIVKYSFNFDSVMITEDDLINGTHRLLEVDNRLILPIGVPIRFLITAVDVLHSWAVPALGVKVDAVPGRLNQFILEIKKPGTYYGQCSELCGPLHGFMPIVIDARSLKEFEIWLSKF